MFIKKRIKVKLIIMRHIAVCTQTCRPAGWTAVRLVQHSATRGYTILLCGIIAIFDFQVTA